MTTRWLYAPSADFRLQLSRLLLAFTGVGLLALLADREPDGHIPLANLVVRVGWSAWILGAGLLVPRVSALGYQVVVGLTLAVGAGHLGALAWLGHGDASVMAWLVAWPLAITVLAQGDVLSVAASALASALTAALVPLALGLPGRESARWGWASFAAGLVAVYGAVLYRRLKARERDEQERRAAALRQLAESEARRSAAERLAVVGRLAAGVAHEINNPLAYARNNLVFVRRQVDGGAPNRGEVLTALDETEQGLTRIAQIVRDLRSFSRHGPEEAPGELTVLREVIDEALRLASVRLGEGVRVQVALPEGLPPVRMGRQRLSQVLVNLLVNAADALEGAGGRSAGNVAIQAQREGNRLRLAVEDDGPGIPEALLPRLGEPFFTTKPPGKGTGLGLALSREYLEQAGGALRAENRPGGGCRVVLELVPGE